MRSSRQPGREILSGSHPHWDPMSPARHFQREARRIWDASLALVLVCLVSFTGQAVQAGDNDLSKEDKACLACHDKKRMTKTLASGEVLSLSISTQNYLESMHKTTSCEDCHANIEAKTHGKLQKPVASRRDFSLGMRESCRDCHKKKFTQYEDSVHAALAKVGNKNAPLCSDCHNPHTVRSSKIVTPIIDTPCAACHQDIFKAYAKDVHGLERIAKGQAAPLCANCHQAHDIRAASLGDGIKDACLACHKKTVQQHRDWLPNAARHFEAISCPACHAPQAQRRVSLRLYDSAQGRQVSERTGVPQFERLTHAADDKDAGLDERALWSLLKEFNRDSSDSRMVLRGRLEVSSGVEAHQLSDKSLALGDCKVCHQAGAEPFQSVSLTMAAADGRPLRHGVQKEVLSSLTAINSVRGFYAIGSTRIKLLDTLLLLVLLGAVSVPLVHMSIKRLFRSVREKLEAERLASSKGAVAENGKAPN